MNTEHKQLRLFTLALSLATLFWLTLIHYWQHQHLLSIEPTFLSFYVGIATFLVIGISKPAYYSGLFRHWSAIAKFINSGINYFLLGIIFFIIITPASLLFRIAGKSILINQSSNSDTYRINSRKISPDEMEHPY